MEHTFSPPLTRTVSSVSIAPGPQAGERTALLAGDEEEGRYYVQGAPGAPLPPPLPIDPKRPHTRWEVFKTRTRYYIPSIYWIPNYSASNLWGDAAAGITVASIIIPQSMSYATSLAKLDPTTGLFAAAVPGFVYALLGTSKHLNVGPEAALSLLIGQAVDAIRRGDPHEDVPAWAPLAASTIITFQVGMISFVLGMFRLGFIDVILSRALQRGFVTAVALVIMIEQLVPMLGLSRLQRELQPVTTVEKFFFLMEYAWTKTHVLTAAISLGCLSFLILTRMIKTSLRKKFPGIFYVPEVFLLVVLSTVLCEALGWGDEGVAILGEVHARGGGHLVANPLSKRNLSYLTDTTSTALLMAVAGYIDSVVAAKQNAARFGYSISPNRELVALGAGNLLASFFPGTMPGYGAITRSKINADCGSQSQMASLITSSLVILAIVFLLPALHYLPMCVLAAIIGLVVYSILAEAPHDIRYYWKSKAWVDFGLMLLTFISTLFWSVEIGIVVSVTVSLLLVVRESSKTSLKILGRIPGTNRWKPIDENPEAEEDIPGVLIVRVRESLNFANAAQMKERLRRLELYGPSKVHPSEEPSRAQAEVIVFHMADVEHLDASAAQVFAEMANTYQSQGVEIHFAHLREKQRRKFKLAGYDVPLDHSHQSVSDAIRVIEARTY
ncbi:hypothetical protein M407DRAFT_20907 [Tulasnella calospora MUT 4182]|uniref:STAS domain-containing protein n=1 Tax=Tulasnella calospora MUT 4182 TaxID=1051891 RepID=A0A0C3QFA5_9AGAM|nr:hypothetical protein M407DRAFT_20907 [Tulasnella calospora MUT 4182]